MPATQVRLMRLLHGLMPAASPEPDAELLARYARLRDEKAFAALVRRHGPMVLSVCQRVVGELHAAEDAFQATFLALARHPGSIRRPGALAAWLYGTAHRTALKARAAIARRRAATLPSDAEAPPDPRPDPLSQLSARELLSILDEEIQGLTEAHRVAVILCCLDGKTLEEAAQQVGCSMGSLRGRLERGRARLHDRLVRRGLTLAVALAAVEVARVTAAGRLPAYLAAVTVRAALAYAASAPTTAIIPAEAARLAGEIFSGAGAVKAKPTLVLLLVLGLTAFGAISFTQAPTAEPGRKAEPSGESAPPHEATGDTDRSCRPSPRMAQIDLVPAPAGDAGELARADDQVGDPRDGEDEHGAAQAKQRNRAGPRCSAAHSRHRHAPARGPGAGRPAHFQRGAPHKR
jgi:RNA polymerase sigma factor (sigma-70 family)